MSVLNSLGNIVGGVAGWSQGQQNLKMQRDNLEWQKYVQGETWKREDNAVSRRAQDLQNAGLSKTLAAGDGADSGAVVQTTAPQDKTVESVINGLGIMRQMAETNKVNQEAQNLLMENKYTEGKIHSLEVSDAYTKARTLLTNENVASLGYTNRYTEAMTKKANEEANKIMLEKGYTTAQINYITQLTQKAKYDTDIARVKYHADSQELSMFNLRKEIVESQLTKQLLDNEAQRMENVYVNNIGEHIGTSQAGVLDKYIGSLGKGALSKLVNLFSSGDVRSDWKGY